MPDPVDLGHAFGLPPRRAIAYFKSKGYSINWNWWETWQAAHAKSFTVAKAARLDILTDIRSEVQRALDEGITAREFADALEPRLKAKGWWGRQVIVDPAGGADLVQLGSPHRLKTIYRTNLKTARAVAQQQIQRATADKRPYWMYDAMDDARTRPEHAALDGMVFRHDDPFWDTHYPPNGFNCRCRVRAFTAEEIEDRGLVISSSKGKLHQVTQRVGLDKRTGEIVERPATEFRSGRGPTAIRMTPDPGWNYNPGAGGPDADSLRPLLPIRKYRPREPYTPPRPLSEAADEMRAAARSQADHFSWGNMQALAVARARWGDQSHQIADAVDFDSLGGPVIARAVADERHMSAYSRGKIGSTGVFGDGLYFAGIPKDGNSASIDYMANRHSPDEELMPSIFAARLAPGAKTLRFPDSESVMGWSVAVGRRHGIDPDALNPAVSAAWEGIDALIIDAPSVGRGDFYVVINRAAIVVDRRSINAVRHSGNIIETQQKAKEFLKRRYGGGDGE